MTDIKKENDKPLIETEEIEEEISLVSSDQDTKNSVLPIDKPATLESNSSSEWDDHLTKKDPHPLSATIVVEDYDSDPWAQPENALLAVEEDEDEAEDLVVKQPYEQTPATATVFDAIHAHPEHIVSAKEDQDTSAIKVSL